MRQVTAPSGPIKGESWFPRRGRLFTGETGKWLISIGGRMSIVMQSTNL